MCYLIQLNKAQLSIGQQSCAHTVLIIRVVTIVGYYWKLLYYNLSQTKQPYKNIFVAVLLKDSCLYADAIYSC